MKTVRTVGYVALALAIAYVSLGAGIYYWKEYVDHPEAGALADLEALHRIQLSYKHDHGHHAESFQQLGAPLGATVTGQILDWRGGYLFSLVPVRRDWSDEITGYVILARPQVYRFGSKKSLSVDDLGTVRYTTENRSPNNRDPVETIVPLDGAGSEVLRLRTGHECAYAAKKKYESHGFIYQAHIPSAYQCTAFGESWSAASAPRNQR
jgi:hypothetical protein